MNKIPGFLKTFQTAIDEMLWTSSDGAQVENKDALDQLSSIISSTRPNNKVMLIGNGGSAAIASHAALDLWKNGNINATAFNDLVQLTALSNDFGFENVFVKAIERFAAPGDVLLAISSSGQSKNILSTPDIANRRGCRVITFSGFRPDNPLRSFGELNLYVPSHRYGIVESAHQAVMHGLIEELEENGAT